MAPMKTLELDAIVKGTAVSIVVCLPLALLSQAIADSTDDDPSRWAFVLFFGVLLGFVLGGYLTARSCHDYPYTNGAVAALAAYVIIQGVAVVVRLVGDDDIRVVAIVFNGLVSYGCGLTGALIGARKRSVT
jgi:putative membrane protein (TIGR04086 family)